MDYNTCSGKEKVFKYEKNCVVCENNFQTNYSRKKACSKECKRIMDNERSRKWREDNREQFLSSLREWNKNNKERKSESDRLYREKNRDEVLEKKRAHYQENKEHYRQYRIDNKEQRSQYMENYRRNNRKLFQEKEARREARKLNAFVEDIDRSKIFKDQNGLCNLCNRKLVRSHGVGYPLYPNLDHIVPLSKGGFHGMENAQYLCRECNIRKSDNISKEWGNKDLYEKFKREERLVMVTEKSDT